MPGLYFCANYRGGVSIGDCVKAGHATADRVADLLRLRGAGIGRRGLSRAAEEVFPATVLPQPVAWQNAHRTSGRGEQ